MRILNVIFSKYMGGLERAGLDYAKALKGEGADVTLLLRSNAPYIKEAESLGASVITQGNHFGHYDLLAITNIRRLLIQLRPEVIFAHGNRAISLMLPAAKGIAPVIAVNHTASVKRSLRASHVITVNQTQKRELIALGYERPDKIQVVGNMLELTDGRASGVQSEFQKPVVIGVMSRFYPEKGVDVFIEALKILHENGVDFQAKIAGDGPLKGALQEQARVLGDKVEFLGWVQKAENFYQTIDLFCLPSRAETFGIVLLEAFSYKLPVVATAVSGPMELAEGYDALSFVPPDNPQELADALQNLIENKEKAGHYGNVGFTLLTEKYTMKKIAKRLVAIAKEVASDEDTRSR